MNSLRNTLCATLAAATAALVIACGGNSSTPAPTPTPTPSPTVSSVVVSGTIAVIGSSSQFQANATLSNGTTQNVTTQATWQTSNPLVATVSATGTVNFVAAGDTDITATFQGVSGRLHVTLTRIVFTLTGVVTDATSGGPLPNVSLVVQDGGNAGRTTTTNSAGTYTLSDLVGGSFTLIATASGYLPVTQTVLVTSNARVDFVLSRVGAVP